MKKKLSLPASIGIVVIAAALAGGVLYYFLGQVKADGSGDPAAIAKEMRKMDTGAPDAPKSILDGAMGMGGGGQQKKAGK